MACGAKGGDVLAYEMHLSGAEFVQAAKNLGAWIDDGREPASTKPTALPPRAALEALAFEATVIAVAAGNVAQGLALNAADLKRVTLAAGRIQGIAGEYAA
jgi:hypothetical protein